MKKVVLLGTNRHAICIDDFYMFFHRSGHDIVHIFYPEGDHKHRDWWKYGRRLDNARNSAVDPIAKDKYQVTRWTDVQADVIPILDVMEFDYICVGNGTDPAHQELIERYGREKFLFSEYGWMPWSECFYISRTGCGSESEIASLGFEAISRLSIDRSGIEVFLKKLDVGNEVHFGDFVYLPLQKDVNDFKFLTSPFKNNMEFIRRVDELAPPGVKILLKCHPLYKRKYDVSFSDRIIDVTDLDLNKAQVYSRMVGMFCINSTSVLEALCFGGRVVTFGEDIFLNKGVTLHRPDDGASVTSFFYNQDDSFRDHCKKFVSLLLNRQINRSRCISDDLVYVHQHYWSLCL